MLILLFVGFLTTRPKGMGVTSLAVMANTALRQGSGPQAAGVVRAGH